MVDYRLEHGLTQHELNARVWAERRFNRDDFWDQVAAVLPYRPRQSIYKYCRRQFHNFPKRGQWTQEEDDELAVAAKEHPQQWKTVGSILNRMPEDCRDRWRNYLKCGEARNKDVWTEQEENLLKQHVREVMAALRKERGNASASDENTPSDEEDVDRKAALINWTVISEKMGGTRSRIQCSYKWKKLENMAAREQERARSNENGIETEPLPKKTWRTKRAEGNFFKMLPGDKYDLLKA
jgi:Myb-like DNA-binding protein REB1